MDKHCGCKINGICCSVSTCKYHTKDNCCDAGEIHVGPGAVDSSADTKCATFECQ